MRKYTPGLFAIRTSLIEIGCMKFLSFIAMSLFDRATIELHTWRWAEMLHAMRSDVLPSLPFRTHRMPICVNTLCWDWRCFWFYQWKQLYPIGKLDIMMAHNNHYWYPVQHRMYCWTFPSFPIIIDGDHWITASLPVFISSPSTVSYLPSNTSNNKLLRCQQQNLNWILKSACYGCYFASLVRSHQIRRIVSFWHLFRLLLYLWRQFWTFHFPLLSNLHGHFCEISVPHFSFGAFHLFVIAFPSKQNWSFERIFQIPCCLAPN